MRIKSKIFILWCIIITSCFRTQEINFDLFHINSINLLARDKLLKNGFSWVREDIDVPILCKKNIKDGFFEYDITYQFKNSGEKYPNMIFWHVNNVDSLNFFTFINANKISIRGSGDWSLDEPKYNLEINHSQKIYLINIIKNKDYYDVSIRYNLPSP